MTIAQSWENVQRRRRELEKQVLEAHLAGYRVDADRILDELCELDQCQGALVAAVIART